MKPKISLIDNEFKLHFNEVVFSDSIGNVTNETYNQLKDDEEILNGDDAELKELVKEEIGELRDTLAAQTEKLKELLLNLNVLICGVVDYYKFISMFSILKKTNGKDLM